MNWLDTLLSWLRPVPAPQPVLLTPGSTSELVAALNAERAKAGRVPRLTESAVLNTVALSWARSMAVTGLLTHGNFDGRISAIVPGRAAAENIAEGQTSVAQVVASWMASPGHRANILGPYRQVGHGEAIGRHGVIYWVVDFAA